MYYLIEAFVSNYTVGRLTDTFNLTEDDIKIIDSAIKETKKEWLEKAKEEERLHDSELNEGPNRFWSQWFDKIVACPENNRFSLNHSSIANCRFWL